MKTKIFSAGPGKISGLVLAILFIASAIPYSSRLATTVSLPMLGALLSPLEVAAILLSVGAILCKSTMTRFIVASFFLLYLILPFLIIGIFQNGIREALADVRALIVVPATYSWTKSYVTKSSCTNWHRWIVGLSWLAVANAAGARVLGGLHEGRLLGLSEPILVTLLSLLVGVREMGVLRRYSILAMAVIIMGLSGTRGMWLTTLITICAIIVLGLMTKTRIWHVSLVGFPMFIVTTLAFYFHQNTIFAERVFSLTKLPTDPSFLIRIADISLALQVGNQRPLLGYGFGKSVLTTTYFTEGMYVDNTWITAYVKGGISLVVECLILLFALVVRLWRARDAVKDERRIWITLMVSWFAYISISSLRGSLLHSPSLLMLGAMCYGVLDGLAMRGDERRA